MTSVSVVVPTFNEARNVELILEGLAKALAGRSWELVVVDDDSPDGTADEVRRLAASHANLRCIQRVQERGLCSAVQWGVQAAHGETIVVMDGDFQHDPAVIPAMLAKLDEGADIVPASRFLDRSSAGGLSSNFRQRLSQHGNRLINLFLGTRLSDPLTGFFATRRRFFLRSIPHMQADGFKILFDLLYHNRNARVVELAFAFRARQHGQSKLQPYVLWLLACDIASKLTGGFAPPRLASFIGVGLMGSLFHFTVLYLSLALDVEFWIAQTIATLTALVFNFTINNLLTYAADRLRGADFYKGLMLYSAVASLGIVANVSTAQITHEHFKTHTFVAAFVGLVIDIIWRFSVSNRLIWGRLSIVRRGK